MTMYSYIVARDYGFAPNPFGGYCTLATCKPLIRKNAKVGDWVIGTGAKTKFNLAGKLIFAMKVVEKLSFDSYWNDPRFQFKKPFLRGSLKSCYGDNIYHRNDDRWHQENSHHSFPNGKQNEKNTATDTRWPYVLISNHFYYLGENCVEIPGSLKRFVCHTGRLHKKVSEGSAEKLVYWLETNFKPELLGHPLQFLGDFERYKGNT